MPVIVVEDDRVLRQIQVLLDPNTSDERLSAFANYASHDLTDFIGWRDAVRASVPELFPSQVRLVIDQEELEQQLSDADIVIVESLHIGESQLALAPKMVLVQNFGVVTENIDHAACTARGVTLKTLRRRTNMALAEHTLMFMLNLAKRFALINGLVTSQRLLEAGFAPLPYDKRHTASANFGRIPNLQLLRHKTLGLLGYGEISREVAPLARAFGMKVLYNKRNRLSATAEQTEGVEYCDFDSLFERADFLSVHVASNEETRHLVNHAALSRMKPGGFLVNTSRAEIVDLEALLTALKSGHLAGAAFDVLYQEPTTEDDPLLEFNNVLLTPHLAGASRLNGLTDAQDMLQGIAEVLRLTAK